jgi:glycosyltransferase involved in cell wall biosynthesis
MTKISVIVATYGRASEFERCLLSLANQQRRPDQVVTVLRSDDTASAEVVRSCELALPITLALIGVPGMIQAHNLGLDSARGDIVCFIDDDAEAHADWLARIEAHFAADPAVGGVGGRDIVHEQGVPQAASATRVGIVEVFGRVVGNHHLGMGPLRRVHTLKGANMSWRATAIAGRRFDAALHGHGAQVNAEMAFCLEVDSRGWQLLYDPAVLVNHFPAVRAMGDTRTQRSLQAIEDDAYNFYVALRCYLRPGLRRRMALAWAWLVGTRAAPGAVRAAISRVRGDHQSAGLRQTAVRAWNASRTHQPATPQPRDDRG